MRRSGDIFRVKNGKLIEHGDVMQEEVPVDGLSPALPTFVCST